MGKCQDYFTKCHSTSDIIEFAQTLLKFRGEKHYVDDECSVLVLWNHKNELYIFVRISRVKTKRTMV